MDARTLLLLDWWSTYPKTAWLFCCKCLHSALPDCRHRVRRTTLSKVSQWAVGSRLVWLPGNSVEVRRINVSRVIMSVENNSLWAQFQTYYRIKIRFPQIPLFKKLSLSNTAAWSVALSFKLRRFSISFAYKGLCGQVRHKNYLDFQDKACWQRLSQWHFITFGLFINTIKLLWFG